MTALCFLLWIPLHSAAPVTVERTATGWSAELPRCIAARVASEWADVFYAFTIHDDGERLFVEAHGGGSGRCRAEFMKLAFIDQATCRERSVELDRVSPPGVWAMERRTRAMTSLFERAGYAERPEIDFSLAMARAPIAVRVVHGMKVEVRSGRAGPWRRGSPAAPTASFQRMEDGHAALFRPVGEEPRTFGTLRRLDAGVWALVDGDRRHRMLPVVEAVRADPEDHEGFSWMVPDASCTPTVAIAVDVRAGRVFHVRFARAGDVVAVLGAQEDGVAVIPPGPEPQVTLTWKELAGALRE